VLIGRCAIYEQLYLTDDVPKNAEVAIDNLRHGLLTLYIAMVQALYRLLNVFKGKSPIDIIWSKHSRCTKYICVPRTLIVSSRKMD